MTDADPTFTDAFPRADEAQWRALVARVLKGAPFERLVSKTSDGIAIEPLYQSLKGERPRALRATPGAWRIGARVDHPDPRVANALALADLEGGADALHIVFQSAVGAYGFGLPATRDAVEIALEGVHFDVGVKFELDMSAQSIDCAGFLADMIEARKIEPASVAVSFGFDPAAQGTDIARALSARGFAGRFCLADGRIVHASGGTEAQELAFVVSAALAHLRALESGGIAMNAARKMLSFRMAADADEFLTLAKFRALRRLWARVEESCGLAPQPIHIHAETAWRMLTRRDPHVNLLRATIACFSAGLGGADVVSVLPFTQALGLPDAFARRLARNTQLVLLEESNLGAVADPAAGAGVFEAMTDALCEKAWALMQDVERAGGFVAALASGAFQAKVANARTARQKLIATRRAPLTGVSEYPQLDEPPVEVLAPMPAAPHPVALLPAMRDSEAFERLRDAADALRTANGKRPKVFLANLGPLAEFSARASFAKNLFEAGGIEAVSNDGFADDAALAAAFKASGAAIACLCSSDAAYVARAATSARALTAAGARQIWLAGKAGDHEAAWKAAGVSGFVYAGCDVIAALESALACAAA